MKVAIESLVIDGESDEDGTMQGCNPGEPGFHPPFALFSPDLQHNVGGPYAQREHAEAVLTMLKAGGMVPYTDQPNVVWTVNGSPSPWYNSSAVENE